MEAMARRLSRLEQWVGVTGATHVDAPVVSALVDVAKQCGNAVERRGDRVAPLWRRLAELERYLDPAFAEEWGGVAPEVKLELILASEDRLRACHARLERLEAGQTVLNAEAFQRVSDLEPRLKEVTKIQLEQGEKVETVNQETLDLVGQYNDIMETVTKTFVHYDQILKEAEAKANPPKNLNS